MGDAGRLRSDRLAGGAQVVARQRPGHGRAGAPGDRVPGRPGPARCATRSARTLCRLLRHPPQAAGVGDGGVDRAAAGRRACAISSSSMWPAPALAVVIAVAGRDRCGRRRSGRAAPFLAAWFLSPLVAFWVSRPRPVAELAADRGRAARAAADRAQDLAVLRDLRRRRGPLAAAGQLPGRSRRPDRPPDLADQPGPAAALDPGRPRPRLSSAWAAWSSGWRRRSTRSSGWRSTGATSTTGTTRGRSSRCPRPTSRPSTAATCWAAWWRSSRA